MATTPSLVLDALYTPSQTFDCKTAQTDITLRLQGENPENREQKIRLLILSFKLDNATFDEELKILD